MKWTTKHCVNTILGVLFLMTAPVRGEGEEMTGDTPPELAIQPIPAQDGGTNSFGMK